MSDRLYDVVCLGETMGQFVPESPGGIEAARSFGLRQAGAESNVAINLARLGHSVSWVSRLGADAVGRRILTGLQAEGVDTSAVEVDRHRSTAVFLKDVTGHGRPVTYYRSGSAASRIDRSDVVRARSRARRLVHTSGITPALSASCADAVAELLSAPRDGLQLSFDVNYRPGLWPDRVTAAGSLRELADAADVVFVGFDEAQALWGVDEIDEVRALLIGPTTLVVKDSDRPAVAFVGDQRYEVAAQPLDVIEPVGAGDAFAAGYLHALLRGWSTEQALRSGHVVARCALLTVDDVGWIDPDEVSRAVFETGKDVPSHHGAH